MVEKNGVVGAAEIQAFFGEIAQADLARSVEGAVHFLARVLDKLPGMGNGSLSVEMAHLPCQK